MLKEALKQATLQDVRNLDLLHLPFYARSNHDVLEFLHSQGIVDDSSLEVALETAVFARAKEDYDLVIKTKGRPSRIYPDHVGRPDCFAYGIAHDVFSARELRKIPFDHEETPETYCQHYGRKNLLANLREELLNPKPLLSLSSDEYYDPHPVCECEH